MANHLNSIIRTMFWLSRSLFTRLFFSSPQFRPRHYVGGISVILLISLLYGFAMRAVLAQGTEFQ